MVRNTRKGFTLVELLVVIGIIAVLISILLPSLARARQSAMTVQCLSNLRTVGQALLLYTDSNKGFYPYGLVNNATAGYDSFWSSTAAAQLTGGSLNAWDSSAAGGMAYFRCPEVYTPREFAWTPGSHYGSHPLVMANVQWGWTYGPLGWQYPPLYKAVWLAKNGSEKALVWDSTIMQPGDPSQISWVGSAFPVSIHVDNDSFWWGSWLIDAPGIWGSGVNTGTINDQVGLNGVFQDEPYNKADGSNAETFRNRHNGETACNFLFADGHAETRQIFRNGTSKDQGRTDLKKSNFTVPYPVPGLVAPGW